MLARRRKRRTVQRNWNPCRLKDYTNRKGQRSTQGGKVNNTFLENNVDVAGGHFRLGSFDHLKLGGNETFSYRIHHFSFFRNALSKLVSARTHVAERMQKAENVEDIIDQVCTEATENLSKGYYYMRYSSYLLTTPQHLQYRSQEQGEEKVIQNVTQVVIENMLRYNILVGIVERFPESLELLQHVLGDDKASAALQEEEEYGLYHRNRSGASSSDIVRAIRQEIKRAMKVLSSM